MWWRRKVVTGRGWMEEGRREGSVKKMVCFLNTCTHTVLKKKKCLSDNKSASLCLLPPLRSEKCQN